MTLNEATKLINTTQDAMDKAFRRPLFDEFAIVARSGPKQFLVWYSGPRRETFPKTFHSDTAALRAEAAAQYSPRYEIGDYEFTAQGVGAESEAFVIVGKDLVLICGNTRMAMAEISKDPLWLAAQRPFVQMSDRFRTDPLVVPNPASGTELAGTERRRVP